MSGAVYFPTSVIKGFDSTIQPSDHSLLLQLPTELLIDIATALNTLYLESIFPIEHPLPALRLTCKRLAEICTPVLFCTTYLREGDATRHYRQMANAQQLGGLVRHLTLVLEDGLVDNNSLPIYEMLSNMPNVRSLFIVHQQQDVAKHSSTHHALEKFVHLESITLQEKEYDPTYTHVSMPTVPNTETFFHTFLCNALKVHSGRLRALHLYTLLPLDPQLYIDIRDKTPNLRAVTFTTNICLDMEGVFSEATPWASGQSGRLESLTFLGCDGIHADQFAKNVLCGVYGVWLKDVQFISSGRYIAHIPKPPSTPVFTSIERMHFDHINAQELSVIALISIEELSLTCITHDAFCRLPMHLEGDLSRCSGTRLGFMGLRRLRLSPKLATEASWKKLPAELKAVYKELRERCLPLRGIQLTLDAVDRRINCGCSDHEWL